MVNMQHIEETLGAVAAPTASAAAAAPPPILGVEMWFDGLSTPVFAIDRNGIITGWNRAMARVTGRTVQEMLGLSCMQLVEDNYHQTLQTLYKDCFKLGKEDSSGEVLVVCHRSTTISTKSQPAIFATKGDDDSGNLPPLLAYCPFKVKVTSIRHTDDEIVGAACFLEPITDSFNGACHNPTYIAANGEPPLAPIHSNSITNHKPPNRNRNSNRNLDLSTSTDIRTPPVDLVGTIESSNHSITVPVMIIQEDGIIQHINESMANLIGYHDGTTINDLLGRNLFAEEQTPSPILLFILPDCMATIQESIRLCLLGKESLTSTTSSPSFIRIRHGQDDSIRYCSLVAMRIGSTVTAAYEDPSSTEITATTASSSLVALIFQDMTDWLQYRTTVTDFQGILKHANLPIFGIDIYGSINLWNDRMVHLSGVVPMDAYGMNLVDNFILSPLRQSLLDVLDHALTYGGGGTSNFELEFKTGTGETRYLLLNVSPRHNEDGNQVIGAVAIAEDVTESALHYRRVAAMARELRQLLDTANALLFGVDEAGRVNEWNDKTGEVLGYSADEAFNQPLIESFIAPDFQEAFRIIQQAAFEGRGTTNMEVDVKIRSEDFKHLLMTATTRRDADNRINGVIYLAQDVTESSKHDRAVASMASELRQLIDTANAPIFGIDCDGDVNEWNDKTAEITGYTKEEAFDCSLVETFIVPHMQDSVQDVLDNALEGRGTSNYELEFRTKSNEIRHLLVNATTRRDAENNVVGVVGVAQDVTEAVQRDRAVAGMALELRQLIDTANAPIFGIDIDGNVNEWNHRTQEITGYSKEETFDEPLVEGFIAPHMQQKVQEILVGALHGNETSNYELEFVSKSGEPRFMLVNATTRRDPEFNVVGVVGVAQDVTEDRKHAAELRKMQYLQATQEAKVETERNMTAYFAHELRNPLGAIDSALNAMPDDLPESALTLISGMRLCSGFMSSIMNNLLDVRKMEEGKMTLVKQPISLTRLVSGVHQMLLPAVRPGVVFLPKIEVKDRDWVLGDIHRLQQVLTNVVTNAIKYTLVGSVTLSVSWEGDHVIFECIDTGPGIPKNEQEKMFQRFVQRGGAPGTGLGLAIAKHLVDLAQGEIRFDSDPSVRPGTTCVVSLQMDLCERPEKSVEVSTVTEVLKEPLRFLIIDDVKMNRSMLKRRIQKGIAPNGTIEEASTGEEALSICGEQSFDVIIVDQYMEEAGGVMVGTDVVYAMRRMRIEGIIIGCSGNDLDAEFAEAGADWIWKKPMPSNEEIITQLRDALEKRQRRR